MKLKIVSLKKNTEFLSVLKGKILDNKLFPITLGGEHSITPGCIKPFVKKYNQLTILDLAWSDFLSPT